MPGKKFRFSLASILRLRQHETERTRFDLAKKMQDRKAQEAEVLEARDQLAEINPDIQTQQTVRVTDLRRVEALKQDARNMLHKANERLEDLMTQEQRTRSDLLQKRSAEEALQTLHDQEKTRHIRDIESAENKQIEEQALDKYRRQQQSNKS